MTKESSMTTMTATTTYATVQSPYGPLLVIEGPDGLRRIAFEHEQVELPADAREGELDAARQLEEYFAGERAEFDVRLDWGSIGGFRRRALEQLAAIPYGETRTYTQLAAAAGNPAAVRAAGSACATNPWPVIVPCHRVLRTDGTLGGFLGGLDMKRGLLRQEGAAV
jgi:methylated-DNA-[protein]-cysteine S-methyltransferase